jgi:hypothetical protein
VESNVTRESVTQKDCHCCSYRTDLYIDYMRLIASCSVPLTCLQVSNSVSVNMRGTVVFKLGLPFVFDAINIRHCGVELKFVADF